MMNGKQITVVWHVDDLKVSHEEMEVLKWFAGMLNEEFSRTFAQHSFTASSLSKL